MYNTPRIRQQIHHDILYWYVIGPALRTIMSARCARSFASLYNHGVPTLQMIRLSANVMHNDYLKERFNEVYNSVSEGSSISDALGKITEFDPMLISMIAVGEETGQIGTLLERTADYFDQESQSAITRMIGLMEPIMIVIMGVIIGFIVISIILPIFGMYKTIA